MKVSLETMSELMYLRIFSVDSKLRKVKPKIDILVNTFT